jgi:hypothetical protein
MFSHLMSVICWVYPKAYWRGIHRIAVYPLKDECQIYVLLYLSNNCTVYIKNTCFLKHSYMFQCLCTIFRESPIIYILKLQNNEMETFLQVIGTEI